MSGVRRAPTGTVRILPRKTTTNKTPSKDTDGLDPQESENETVDEDGTTEVDETMDPSSFSNPPNVEATCVIDGDVC